MEGTAVAGKLFASLDLDDFAVRVVPLNLLQGLFIFLCMQAWDKDSVFYAKEVQVGPANSLSKKKMKKCPALAGQIKRTTGHPYALRAA
jgi:hypothetical protein